MIKIKVKKRDGSKMKNKIKNDYNKNQICISRQFQQGYVRDKILWYNWAKTSWWNMQLYLSLNSLILCKLTYHVKMVEIWYNSLALFIGD